MPFILAVLVFLGVVTVVVGAWWILTAGWTIRKRLADTGSTSSVIGVDLMREDHARSPRARLLSQVVPFFERLPQLVEQAGYSGRAPEALLAIVACALLGAGAGWLRIGGWGAAFFSACAGGAIPLLYLLYRKRRRLVKFERQLPEALDMMARAIRAGNALPAAVQLVAEEMPAPVGDEFRRASDEIRLGIDPGEALEGLRARIPVDDLLFFCTAVRIQRASGGNLAEVFDRLAEVIRERFKLLSYARVLSTEHRWSAVIVAFAPLLLAAMFEFMMPGYYKPLLESSLGPTMLMIGATLEIIGGFIIWRIAQIKV